MKLPRCPKCGLPIYGDSPFLCECGEREPIETPECAGCGRALPLGKRRCLWCGEVAAEAAELPAGLSLPCPRCNGELSERTEDDIIVYFCDGGDGVWLFRHILRRFEDYYRALQEQAEEEAGSIVASPDSKTPSKDQPAPEIKSEGYAHCPVCLEMMRRQPYQSISGIIVDSCPFHGVWFDAGELEAAFQFLGDGGLTKREIADELAARNARLGRYLRRPASHMGAAAGVFPTYLFFP